MNLSYCHLILLILNFVTQRHCDDVIVNTVCEEFSKVIQHKIFSELDDWSNILFKRWWLILFKCSNSSNSYHIIFYILVISKLVQFRICVEIKIISGYISMILDKLKPCRSNRSQMFLKIRFLKNFSNFTKKQPVLEPLGLNIVKKRLQHRCFPVKFAKFLRTLFLIEHVRWCLVQSSISKRPLYFTSNKLLRKQEPKIFSQ